MATTERQDSESLQWRHASMGHYVAVNGCEVNLAIERAGLRVRFYWWAMVPNIVGSRAHGWRALSNTSGVARFKNRHAAMRATERFCAAIAALQQGQSADTTS